VRVAAPASGERGELIERLARRERWVIAAGLLLVTTMSWWYLFSGAGMEMGAMDMRMPMPWSAGYATLVFLMWWVMMTAMMLPSAAPMILLFALVNRKNRVAGSPYVSTTIFASGYLIVWGLFSLLATGTHWLLDQAGLLSAQMSSHSTALGGLLLVLAGIYQLTPYKHACLRHCRGPLAFVIRYWRPGRGGALIMGLRHGALCVGCCWVVMGLLFYGGVMNLYWITGIAALVLLEKLFPAGDYLGYAGGFVFIVWGMWLLAGSGVGTSVSP
jgi:predicted metal-binding membrane protein